MAAVPWQLVLIHPLGITLTILTTFLFVFLMILIMRTPALTFFKGSFGKKMILINPDEDRRMMFRIAKKEGDMAHVKKKGYYIIDPAHVHIEGSSKIPVAITYGSFAESLDAKDAEIVGKLKEAGVKNYDQIMDKLFEDVTGKKMEEILEKRLKENLITKEEYNRVIEKISKDIELNPNVKYTIPKKNIEKININGKSVGFDNIIQYFSKNTRADLIESKIQHRISAMKMDRSVMQTDIFKWAIILVIILIGAALAYNMVRMGQSPAPVTQTAAQAVKIPGQGLLPGTGLS